MDVGEEEITELELARLRRALASLRARASVLREDIARHSHSEGVLRQQSRLLELAALRRQLASLAAEVRESEQRQAEDEAQSTSLSDF